MKTRDGSSGKKEVTRRCTGCGGIFPKAQLIRIVRSPDGAFHPDLTGRAKGRGAYLCRKQACLETAAAKKGLERSFRGNTGKDIYEKLKEEYRALGIE